MTILMTHNKLCCVVFINDQQIKYFISKFIAKCLSRVINKVSILF